MSSRAVNVNSTLNYIARQMGVSVNKVKNWFPNESKYSNYILNIGSVAKIFSRMIDIGFGDTVSNPIQNNTINSYACSENTLKALYSKMMGSRTWKIITSTSALLYGTTYKNLNNTADSATFYLVGGGGGGAGGSAGATDKNDNPSAQGGNGASGKRTNIYVNGSSVASANGGSGGAGVNTGTITNTRKEATGNPGVAGSTATKTISIPAYATIFFAPGAGGGGGGGVSFRITADDYNGTTVYGGHASGATGGDGYVISQNNGMVAASGGGGGGAAYANQTAMKTKGGAAKLGGSGTQGAQGGYNGTSVIKGALNTYSIGGYGGGVCKTTGTDYPVTPPASTYNSAGSPGDGGVADEKNSVYGCTGGNGGCSGLIRCDSWANIFVNQID